MNARITLSLAAVVAVAVATACRTAPDPEVDARLCLDEAVASLDTPASNEDHAALTCADPFGEHRCRAAWRAVAERSGERPVEAPDQASEHDAAIAAAITACREPMCARVGGGPGLCLQETPPAGFLGQMLWVELFRAALERELDRPRVMALLGFWQGLSQPRVPGAD